MFFFFSTKIINTGGEGGFITTNNFVDYKKCKSISAIGIDLQSDTELYSIAGSNNRMTEIQSIIGISQLKELNNFINHRINLSNIYKDALDSLKKSDLIRFQDFPKNIRHPFWKFIVMFNEDVDREKIKKELNSHGIAVDWPYHPLIAFTTFI